MAAKWSRKEELFHVEFLALRHLFRRHSRLKISPRLILTSTMTRRARWTTDPSIGSTNKSRSRMQSWCWTKCFHLRLWVQLKLFLSLILSGDFHFSEMIILVNFFQAPQYKVTSQTGPPNNPTFSMVCCIQDQTFLGEGKSKKEAKLACSQKAIEAICGHKMTETRWLDLKIVLL